MTNTTTRPVARPVHKALHRPLTVCGVDRRLFFLALLMGAVTFNLFYSFLVGLLVALEAETPDVLVIDLVEQDLDRATQEALVGWLRMRTQERRRLILLTRSSSILDLDAVGGGEAIIYCPANHSPPTCVAPYPASPGYEGVATCLASPEVRARTAGTIAWRPSI